MWLSMWVMLSVLIDVKRRDQATFFFFGGGGNQAALSVNFGN